MQQNQNASRGVISERDILYPTKEELLQNSEDQNSVNVTPCYITIPQNEQVIPMKHVILASNTPALPT